MKRRFFSIAMVAGALALAGCRAQTLVTPEAKTNNIGLEKMKSVIIGACHGRGWVVRQEGQGHMVATYTKGPHIACVDIYYTGDSYRIVKNDKTTLVKPGGNVDNKYNQWVKNLAKDINTLVAHKVALSS